jgi:hypothetical protein
LPCPQCRQRPGGLPPPYRCQVRVRACSCGHNPTRDARAGHRVDRGDQRALFCDQNAVSGRWAASRQAMATCDGCEMTGAWRVTSDPRCRSTRTRVGSTSGGNSSTVWSHYPPRQNTHSNHIAGASAQNAPQMPGERRNPRSARGTAMSRFGSRQSRHSTTDQPSSMQTGSTIPARVASHIVGQLLSRWS